MCEGAMDWCVILYMYTHTLSSRFIWCNRFVSRVFPIWLFRNSYLVQPERRVSSYRIAISHYVEITKWLELQSRPLKFLHRIQIVLIQTIWSWNIPFNVLQAEIYVSTIFFSVVLNNNIKIQQRTERLSIINGSVSCNSNGNLTLTKLCLDYGC